MTEKLTVVKTLSGIDKVLAHIASEEYIAYDIESTGLSQSDSIIGYSVSGNTSNAFYVILRSWNKELNKLEELETNTRTVEVLEALKKKCIIAHNAVFDCALTRSNYGVDLMPSIHTDTMILAHLLDENRPIGLKELGISIFGESSADEQKEMKASIQANGGGLTKANYELFKADAELIGKYGAKDALLTIKLFYHLLPQLYDQKLESFFYQEESMPLIRTATYDLNTTGLKIDKLKLAELKKSLEAECLEDKAYINKEVFEHVKDKYPGTGKTNVFNIDSSTQRAWLLYTKLGNSFSTLTKEGREVAKYFNLKLPYTFSAQRDFVHTITAHKGKVWAEGKYNPKTKKIGNPKKVRDVWNYICADRAALTKLAEKYKWVKRYLSYAKNLKLLTTYVEGIESRMNYGIIHPSFKQAGTSSGRYSSSNPNFQNLPRDDKRVKSCIIPRPGNVFVAADYSQLEPRIFASLSNDKRLLSSFKDGDDFYSVIGAAVYDKYDCSLKKEDPGSFAEKYPNLRQIAKVVALSSTYGTTAAKMAPAIGKNIEEAQDVIDSYFSRFPSVYNFMLQCHESAKKEGVALSYFGRPRRMPEALNITKLYGKTMHADLPYKVRGTLNQAVNHRVQSTAASVVNRAAIAFCYGRQELAQDIPEWKNVKIVLQVHDELVVECPESIAEDVATILKKSMETTVIFDNIDLIADPKTGKNLADTK